ncbi:MAG: dihydroorotase [Oscillospiraceae bacterium]|nr:dihydroorotase [Oscillospiraceae bacterium]
MNIYLKNTRIYRQGSFSRCDVLIRDGELFFPAGPAPESAAAVDGRFICILPGLADVHVHLREPGFSYKETIRTGTMAAARGGYTAVCPMPNLNPVPDSLETLEQELSIIRRDAVIPTVPYGAITRGEDGQELADMEAMAPHVAAFSDDGKGVQNPAMMEQAMEKAKALGKIIAAHCEDNSLLHGGYIHDGAYAAAHGHRGICSESEYAPIRRDAALAEKTGCAYHVCHVSTKESVEIIRHAKSQGVNITCETAPHYLLLDDSMLQEDGRFKMNPPLRSPEDRQALLEGLLDGTIDMIATDHAPHSQEEKSRGLKDSPMGVVGLECSFPVLYTGLVETGILSLEKLTALMSDTPRARFGLESDPGFALFDLAHTWRIDPEEFASLGRATPFEGFPVRGRCLMTVCQGREVYIDPMLTKEAGQ